MLLARDCFLQCITTVRMIDTFCRSKLEDACLVRQRAFSIFYSEKNRFSFESLRFACALGEALRRQGLTPTLHHAEPIAAENRPLIDSELGVYRFDDLVVLKRAIMPAVLLECGVIVNRTKKRNYDNPGGNCKLHVQSLTQLTSSLPVFGSKRCCSAQIDNEAQSPG